MSVCTQASTAARSAVSAPFQATIASTFGVSANSHSSPRQQVHARRHHRRRVNQRRDRRRPFHRVGQPDVQRELRRLAHRAEVDAEGDDAKARRAGSAASRPGGAARRDRTCRSPAAAGRCRSSSPTSPAFVVQNALSAARAASGFAIPEADQQVRADADQLPADEELQQIRREHHAHHREGEQRLERVVAAERRRRLVAQIAGRIDLHQQRHQRHQQQHRRWTARRRARRRSRTARARQAATARRRGSVLRTPPAARQAEQRGDERRRSCTRSRTTRPGGPTGAAAAARR